MPDMLLMTVRDLKDALHGMPTNAVLYVYVTGEGTKVVAEGIGGYNKTVLLAPSAVPAAGGPAVVL